MDDDDDAIIQEGCIDSVGPSDGMEEFLIT